MLVSVETLVFWFDDEMVVRHLWGRWGSLLCIWSITDEVRDNPCVNFHWLFFFFDPDVMAVHFLAFCDWWEICQFVRSLNHHIHIKQNYSGKFYSKVYFYDFRPTHTHCTCQFPQQVWSQCVRGGVAIGGVREGWRLRTCPRAVWGESEARLVLLPATHLQQSLPPPRLRLQ